MNLQGKVAIVTGATKGIGKAVVEKLVEAGAYVAICGRDQENGMVLESQMKEKGGQALYVESDLLNRSVPEKIVQQVVNRWNKIDILINNAAMVCHKPIEEVKHENWEVLFEVNLKAPFFMIQAALPWLKESKGNVVNVSSINAWLNAPKNIVYDTMKAALNHLTRGLSLDLREYGVRVNAVMPGGTVTPLLDQWLQQVFSNPEEAQEQSMKLKNDPDMATPEQVADAIVLLISDKASWINGAVIPLDGGVHLKRS